MSQTKKIQKDNFTLKLFSLYFFFDQFSQTFTVSLLTNIGFFKYTIVYTIKQKNKCIQKNFVKRFLYLTNKKFKRSKLPILLKDFS